MLNSLLFFLLLFRSSVWLSDALIFSLIFLSINEKHYPVFSSDIFETIFLIFLLYELEYSLLWGLYLFCQNKDFQHLDL